MEAKSSVPISLKKLADQYLYADHLLITTQQ